MLQKETQFKMTREYESRLEQTINLLLYTPVLNMQNELVPMNQIIDVNKLGEIIDFDASTEYILPMSKENTVMQNCLKIFRSQLITVAG